jgi:hypothetical protein
MKKKCLILSNCFNREYTRFLKTSERFNTEYEITSITTYNTKPNQNYITTLKDSDLIISQNVKNINEYTNIFISQNIKPNAIHIKTEFWRFNGFWSYKSINERKSDGFWFPTDEFIDDLSFDQYMNFDLDEKKVKANFEVELEKLNELDKLSDIKIYPIFMANYKNKRLFSDHYHPMPFIFKHVTNEILKICGINDHVDELNANSTNSERYRLITNTSNNILGINPNSDPNLFIYFGKEISREKYYEFTKFLQTNCNFFGMDMKSVRDCYDQFLRLQ